MIVENLLDAIYEASLHDELHSTSFTRGLVNIARATLASGPVASMAHSLVGYAELAQSKGCVKGAAYANAAARGILEELK